MVLKMRLLPDEVRSVKRFNVGDYALLSLPKKGGYRSVRIKGTPDSQGQVAYFFLTIDDEVVSRKADAKRFFRFIHKSDRRCRDLYLNQERETDE